MWFFFGFITLGVACISALLYRLSVSWHGDTEITQGIPYEYAATTIKSRVRFIRVGVSCSPAYSFILKPEGSFDRISKAIGLTKECQTGDAAFDEAVYVLSDDLGLHRMLQLDAKLRANVLRLMAQGNGGGKLKSIQAHNGRLWVVVKPDSKDEEEAGRTGRLIVPALKHLAGDFLVRKTLPERHDPFPFRAACMLAISTGLAINGGIALMRIYAGDFPFMRDPVAPLPGSILIGIAAILLLIGGTLWFVGRSARAHLVLVELLLVGGFGTIATAYAELRDFNMEFDRQMDARHASVTGTYDTFTRSRRGSTRHCHVQMVGWPYADRETTREMSCGFADHVQTGTQLEVQTHPGALGWPWVGDFVIR